MNEIRQYDIFLLRLPHLEAGADESAPALRVILEDTRTGERHAFADGAALVAFLVAVAKGHVGEDEHDQVPRT
jgi:hypothetical protein